MARLRLAVRAVLVDDDERLLLVNAWPGNTRLWCAPGGGVEAQASLPENLVREVYEETGLRIEVEAPCLVNEFHDPKGGFHQVEVFFRAQLAAPGPGPADWRDPEGVVTSRRWVTKAEFHGLETKPDSLADLAWGPSGTGAVYDPLELVLRPSGG